MHNNSSYSEDFFVIPIINNLNCSHADYLSHFPCFNIIKTSKTQLGSPLLKSDVDKHSESNSESTIAILKNINWIIQHSHLIWWLTWPVEVAQFDPDMWIDAIQFQHWFQSKPPRLNKYHARICYYITRYDNPHSYFSLTSSYVCICVHHLRARGKYFQLLGL